MYCYYVDVYSDEITRISGSSIFKMRDFTCIIELKFK